MNKIVKVDNLKIVYKNDEVYCIKKGNNDVIEKLRYLKSKDFNNFIDTKYQDGYEIRDYIKEVEITSEDKLNELVYIISLLHTKTTFYKNISLNEIKTFYEEETEEIYDIKKDYEALCDKYDANLFMPFSMNLLVRNISLFLISLDNSKYFLDEWYRIMKDKQRKRVVFNHNNLKLSNFIVGDYSYLINWNNSIIDSPVVDIYSLFKNNYKDIDIIDAFDIYTAKYQLLEEEKYLLYHKLCKIEALEVSNDEILNTRKVYDKVIFLKKVFELLKNNVKR